MAQCYSLPTPGRFITPGGASTMGFGPAAAIGVQIAEPDRVVVALVGDGGMSAQLAALPMAVEQGTPVIFVVMNNRAHATVADLQAANFGGSYGCEFLGPDGLPYSPDFAALARACGADGYLVEQPADLGSALRTWGDPAQLEPNQTLAGGELRVSFFLVNVGVAVLSPVAGFPDDDRRTRYYLNIGLGI